MAGHKSEEKRSKKQKKSDEKKRPRDEDEDDKHRKHKRSKSDAVVDDGAQDKKKKKSKRVDDADIDGGQEVEASIKKEKKKKSKKQRQDAAGNTEVEASDDAKEKKKRKKEAKKAKAAAEVSEDGQDEPDRILQDQIRESMDIDSPPTTNSKSTSFQPLDTPSDPKFPFFTQVISLYVPLYPIGFDKPISSVGEQHLAPMLNHYSPLLGGVLLAYRNVGLSERAIRPDPKNPPTDKTPAVLASIDEYAVGFGWLTADVDLFVPSRGAWLEGNVNLQTEGHIGVVCWDKFNASIEAKRMPRGWRFIDLVGGQQEAAAPDAAAEQDPFEDEENGEPEVEQMHATGYWVDAAGRRIKGKLRFRIKNFDVGIAGDHGYLSIEGTMLTEDEERDLAAEEREAERRRKLKTGGPKREARRAPAFSVTNFGREDQQEDSMQKQEVYKGSRPGTPDD
ncbi:uncharacterized protein E0L32_002194 [Thyridium curvatum]|uniref:DNA-directed RNA polymerase subunit n=1 Tax=Thyridium curvatum TaxID=1093900 RepID=A0A507APE6_9PEZI|nr:uncharacterized protein E0L32_002194 [Thyridium curvatum]TPX06698.1 hypothetical protein E0L32_002194 [Thyridium curvatum]